MTPGVRALQHAPPFICGVLFLLSEVLKAQKGLAMLITQPQTKFKLVEGGAAAAGVEVEDDEEEHFRDVLEDEEEEKKLKEKLADLAVREGHVVNVISPPGAAKPVPTTN